MSQSPTSIQTDPQLINMETRARFAALPIYVKRLLQIYALFGQLKLDKAVHRVRQIRDPDLPVLRFNKLGVEQTLAQYPDWFCNGVLPFEIRNIALADLLAGKYAEHWETALFDELLRTARQYNTDEYELRHAARCLLILMGKSPLEIRERHALIVSFYFANIDDPRSLCESLPMVSLALVKDMHVRFQGVMLARYLSAALADPSESIAAWLACATQVYSTTIAKKVDFDAAPENVDLLLQTAIASVLVGSAKGSDYDDLPWLALAVGASVALQNQETEAALKLFEAAQKVYRSVTGKRHLLPNVFGVLYFFALYAKDDPAAWKIISALLKVRSDTHDLYAIAMLQQHGESTLSSSQSFEPSLRLEHGKVLDFLTLALLVRWRGADEFTDAFSNKLKQSADSCDSAGLAWLARQLREACSSSGDSSALLALKTQVLPWQSLLKVLEETEAAKPAAVRTEELGRLQLFLLQIEAGSCFLYLGEQRKISAVKKALAAKKTSAKPQIAAAKQAEAIAASDDSGESKFETKLFNSRATFKSALARISNEQDLRIASFCFRDPEYLQYSNVSNSPDQRAFWSELIGHPQVFYFNNRDDIRALLLGSYQPDPKKRVEVQLGKIELQVSAGQSKETAQVELRPSISLITSSFGISVANGELRVIDVSPAQRRVLAMLERPISMPNSVLPQLADITSRVSAPVRINLDQASDAPVQAGDLRMHVLLHPFQNGLDVQLRVRPFGVDVGPYFAPGEGDRRVIGVVNEQICNALRDLPAEAKALDALQMESPLLSAALAQSGAVPDPEAALDLLAELQLASSAPILAWPKGKAKRVLIAQKFNISSTSGRDWLGIEAELDISEGSIKLSELIGLLENSRGRYLMLDSERVVQISESLRKRVQAIARFADARGKVELPLLAGSVLTDSLGLNELVGAEHKKLSAMNAKMARAFTLSPELPSTLQAELRDYQISGYRWLMQMAHWGAGACLADDMGLGKTVQALALLLARAAGGAAMVIAPTSVVGNWQREAARFAPTLNVRRFDELDRSAQLPELAAFDVLLVSYGLLSTHAENLAKLKLHTLVLDEAQAIKNASTQRAQAACNLAADFRVATTGTPLENNLGELWSLMNFLNPGLLSSQEKFQRRFANPIERDASAAAKATLRALIAPFLLRRTKSQVLSELPPKTEITLTITPSKQEAELVVAMRAAALAKIGQISAATNEQRFHILAEITRLRRAACHPDLVAPELKIPSAKLTQLLELVLELRENRHRALIFSQFVDYLSIVRAAFDSSGISYQYLDGSTTSRARDNAVAAFQAGESDVFILSLKAGGVGLNLTAADYVIHLDPWWNPAVEQQASDRAHRIGQTRPVTIYRLVLQGSIEEQILSLHGQKRELIDSMLSERETAKPVSADELLALIAGD